MFAKKAKKNKAVKQAEITFMFCGATGIWTPVTRMRTARPRPLDDSAKTTQLYRKLGILSIVSDSIRSILIILGFRSRISLLQKQKG